MEEITPLWGYLSQGPVDQEHEGCTKLFNFKGPQEALAWVEKNKRDEPIILKEVKLKVEVI